MRVSPFTYLAPSGDAVIPLEDNIIMRYEDPNTNFSLGVWADTAASASVGGSQIITGSNTNNGGRVTASLATNQIILNNAAVGFSDRKNHLVLETTNDTVYFKSFCVVFNKPLFTGGQDDQRAYFFDARDANNASPDNGGFFNQVDGTAQGTGSFLGPNGDYFSWTEGNTYTNVGATTNTNLVNGTGNDEGGTEFYQWLGPNGRSSDSEDRMRLWHFNCNQTPDNADYLGIMTGSEGMYWGGNDGLGSEASSIGYGAIIYWDTVLSYAQFIELVAYFKGTGALPSG